MLRDRVDIQGLLLLVLQLLVVLLGRCRVNIIVVGIHVVIAAVDVICGIEVTRGQHVLLSGGVDARCGARYAGVGFVVR